VSVFWKEIDTPLFEAYFILIARKFVNSSPKHLSPAYVHGICQHGEQEGYLEHNAKYVEVVCESFINYLKDRFCDPLTEVERGEGCYGGYASRLCLTAQDTLCSHNVSMYIHQSSLKRTGSQDEYILKASKIKSELSEHVHKFFFLIAAH
jgi:hypothetical protein